MKEARMSLMTTCCMSFFPFVWMGVLVRPYSFSPSHQETWPGLEMRSEWCHGDLMKSGKISVSLWPRDHCQAQAGNMTCKFSVFPGFWPHSHGTQSRRIMGRDKLVVMVEVQSEGPPTDRNLWSSLYLSLCIFMRIKKMIHDLKQKTNNTVVPEKYPICFAPIGF